LAFQLLGDIHDAVFRWLLAAYVIQLGCRFDGATGAADLASADASLATGDAATADAGRIRRDARSAFVDPPIEDGTLFALRDANIDDFLASTSDVSGLGGHSWISLQAPDDFESTGGNAGQPEDLSARVAARWDPQRLYFAVVVRDDVQRNDNPPPAMWQGDSVQLGFDVQGNGGENFDRNNDFEFGWALSSSGANSHRWVAPITFAPFQAQPFHIAREGDETIYQFILAPSQLGLASFDSISEVRFDFLINEADNGDRDGYLQWQGGLGHAKQPSLFGRLVFYPDGPNSPAL
jgi:hypothetical protein